MNKFDLPTPPLPPVIATQGFTRRKQIFALSFFPLLPLQRFADCSRQMSRKVDAWSFILHLILEIRILGKYSWEISF